MNVSGCLDTGHLADFSSHMPTTAKCHPDPLATWDNLKLAEIVHYGVPSTVLKELARELGMGLLELADVLQLARRTVTRRLGQGKRLTPTESERVLRVKRLLLLADD